MLRKFKPAAIVLSLVLLSLFSPLFITDVYAAPDDATLSDLTIDGVTVDGFVSDVLSYDVTVGNDVTQIDIAAVAADANAAISGNTGTQSLAVGLNTFTVTCQSEDLSASNDYVINVSREASTNAAISYIRVDGEVIDGFSTDIYVYDIDVKYNEDHVEIEAGTIHTEAVVSGDLDTQVLYAGVNSLTVTCTAEDGVTTKDYVINFNRASSSSTALTDIGFVPTEVAPDPDRDIAYLTAQGGYSLYRADLSTGDITYMTFENRASNFVVANGNIYLALLHAEHTTSDIESGTIGIIDTASFTPASYFDVAINPFDIEVDTIGTVYISNGMTNNDQAKSYNSATGALLSTITMDEHNYLDYNPVYNKIYSLFVGGSPHYLYGYETTAGAFTTSNKAPYYDEYSMNLPIAVSPDGQFIFTGGGNIFTCAATSVGDLIYFDYIENYDSICFDSNNGVFYIVDEDNTSYLLTYDYSTLEVTNQFTARYAFSQIFYSNDKLVYLQRKSYSDGYFFSLNPEQSASITNVTGVTLSSDEINIMPGDYERLTETISPSNATNLHVIWTSSNPSIATYKDGEVYAQSEGTCEITVTTLDGGYVDSCIINVSATPYIGASTTAGNGLNNLGFIPFDVVLDPGSETAYLTEQDGNKLYQVDLTTGAIKYMEFVYEAEYLAIKDGELYLTLGRNYYYGAQQNGKVIIVDTNTFTVSSYLDMSFNPTDIVVDEKDILYVILGTELYGVLSYDTNTWTQISNTVYIPTYGVWEFNNLHDKLYMVTTSGTPKDIYAYEMTNGVCDDIYNSPYHGDYEMRGYIKITPDGQYIFNSSGNIFTCAAIETGDMIYDGNINEFNAVCFDLANNNFFTVQNNVLKVYDYDTRTIVKEYTDENNFADIFYWINKLIALKINAANEYYFDTTTGTGINVTGITIDDAQIKIGETADLNTVISPSDATNKTVSYSSSNESVATVNASGVVTAHAVGIATITVTTEDKELTDTCTVEVIQPVTGVELDVETANIVTGDTGYTLQLNATVLPVDAGNQNVTFASSDETIATVDNTGLVTAVDDGSVTITVTTEEGGFTDTCTVNVEVSLIKGTYTSAANGLTSLGFVPFDSVIDSNGNYAYLTETDGYRLYRVNLSTGQVEYIEFRYRAESIDIKNGKIYVALLHRDHTDVTGTDVSGTIVVIDEATFAYQNHFDINTDPWDIEVDYYGYIYISPGSGEQSKFSSYNTNTGEWVSTINNIVSRFEITYNTMLNKLYITNERGISEWPLENGVLYQHYNWDYTGVHVLTNCTEMSPDYNYIFNGAGYIYTSSYYYKDEIKHDATIDPFTSICFALNSNVFYTSQGNTLTAYDYYTREAVNTHTSTDEFVEVYYENSKLISLNKNASDEYYFDFNTKSSAGQHKVAILFGMSSYYSPTSQLKGPINDVIALKEVLEYSGYKVYVYREMKAAQMLNYTYYAASTMSPDNTLLFAYSGHGTDGGYLVGIDNVLVSINDLETSLSQHTGIKEVLIDACYSGDFISKDMNASSLPVLDASKDFNDYVIEAFGGEKTAMATKSLDQNGYFVITASSGDQLSYEYLFNLTGSPFAENNLYVTKIDGRPYYWMGFFSTAFEDGFGLFNNDSLSKVWADQNRDNVLTWNEIYQYAAAATSENQQAQVYPENSDHVLCNISNVLVTGVTVDNVQVDIGSTQQLNVTIAPADATYQNVIYASSDENIVTVDASGLVTGVSFGTATITVMTIDGGYTDTCTVTSGVLVESIAITPETLNTGVGETYTLTTTITPSNATNQSVTYTSSDEAVATVDAIGMVWAHSAGTATITVTTEDGSFTDTCEVTVVVPVVSVELNKEKCYLEVGGTVDLDEIVLPLNATYPQVTYTSSNEAVATVDADGVVTANALGSAVITVTTQDGGHTDTCDITVSDELIISSVFTVDRVNTYLTDMPIGTTVEEIVFGIDNVGAEIAILDINGNQITGVPVSTGFTVQLIIGGEIADELIILIEGDVNPNGVLDIIDYTLVRLHILNVKTMEGYIIDAADVNNDGRIDIIDYTLIRLHILNVRSLYE